MQEPYIFTFDVTKFREMFPEFVNPADYPDARLQMYWDMATCYVSDVNYGWLSGNCRFTAINLMTAHLTALSVIIAAGQTPGFENQAKIDKITVSLTPPPDQTQYGWWLDTTPYGMQLAALLSAKSVAGFYIGGSPEILAFRKVGGYF